MPTLLAWGIGWTVGPILYFVAVALLAQERASSLALLLILLAGAFSFGLPTLVAARRGQARSPLLQAGAWTVSFFVAMSVVALAYAKPHQLARPGDLNINTSETMLERQQSFDRWGLPPDIVARRTLLIGAIAGFAFMGAALSALVAGAGGSARKCLRVVLYGLSASAAVVSGAFLALLMVATYVLLPVAGLSGCCLAGALVEQTRRLLLADRPARLAATS